jgi:hypothetical protein
MNEQLTGSINYSTLKRMWQSTPLHYHHGVTAEREDTDALRLGRATHCAILEPGAFDDRYVVRPMVQGRPLDLRTREGKAWAASAGDREALSWKDGALVEGMARAAREHPVSRAYLDMDPRDTERRLEWTDAETGAPCHGTPDRVIYAVREIILLGIKTTRKIAPIEFAAEAWRIGYHLQWAYYHDALAGSLPVRVIEIVVENTPPHDVVVYRVPEYVIDCGRREYRAALSSVLECRARGEWPGHEPDAEREFTPPSWANAAELDDNFTVGGTHA